MAPKELEMEYDRAGDESSQGFKHSVSLEMEPGRNSFPPTSPQCRPVKHPRHARRAVVVAFLRSLGLSWLKSKS